MALPINDIRHPLSPTRESIAALGERLGSVDHVVATASARARGRIADLDRDAIRPSFDTFVLFSGVAAAKIAIGTLGVAITNGAADILARSLWNSSWPDRT